MLKAGKCICPRCGHVFGEAYFNDGTSQKGVNLRWRRDSSGRRRFFVVPEGEDEVQEGVKLIDRALETGLPDAITVDDGGDIKTLRRYCPRCKENQTKLPQGWGTVPTYVVCVVGESHQGKTALLTALSMLHNLNALQDSGRRELLVEKLHQGTTAKAESTQPGELGETKPIGVKGPDGRLMAYVLFRDVAGELLKKDKDLSAQEQEYLGVIRRMLRPNGEQHYPGADAFLFVQSAETEESLTGTIDFLIENFWGKKWPLSAFVLTHADICQESGVSGKASDGQTMTLLDGYTFRPMEKNERGYYAPERLIPRMKLENALARELSPVFAYAKQQGGRMQGFLVKSCEKQDEQYDNYLNPINVMDPILYVLNQLGLVDITRVPERHG